MEIPPSLVFHAMVIKSYIATPTQKIVIQMEK
jgi:hypothetical protein